MPSKILSDAPQRHPTQVVSSDSPRVMGIEDDIALGIENGIALGIEDVIVLGVTTCVRFLCGASLKNFDDIFVAVYLFL